MPDAITCTSVVSSPNAQSKQGATPCVARLVPGVQ